MHEAASSTKPSFAKRLQALILSAVLLASGLVAYSASYAPVAESASAASGADFNPGSIMSDAVFYDSGTMTVGQIQAFLNSKVPNCRAGYTCLKDYRQNTAPQAAKSAGCSAYSGGSNLSAAQIIANVAAVCGVNPQVLLVLLEKEQGLVSDSWPTDRQFRSATGFGCPDTADCDAQYYGFFNQLYNASWQFKKYQASPEGRGYQAGRWNTIGWHPNGACGTSQVFIENQATAGLYIYTPYRPNQAALNNMYGTGDGCSSYGNRNFFRMFTDWFGSTTGGGHFARTADNPSLYLISGSIKYPVPSMEVYVGLSALGTFRTVGQAYLDGFTTSSKWASLVIRDPLTGSVYLTQGGVKSQFPSCAMVSNYGYNCGDAIDLTTSQLSRWSTSPLVSGFFVVPGSGDVYYLTAGGRYHVYEWSTVVRLNGGTAPFVATMRSGVAANYPIIRTLLRPQTLVKSSSSTDIYFIDGLDQKVHISSFALAAEYGATGYTTVPQSMIDGYPTAPAVLSIANTCAGNQHLAADGKLLPWTNSTDAAGLAITGLSADTCERMPRGDALSGKIFVKSPDSASVYGIAGGALVSFSSWTELLASNGGVSPKITSLSSGTIATLPKAPSLQAGAVVRSASDPMIYFIDGSAQRIAVSSFVTTAELGKPGWSTVSDQALSSYPKATGFVSRMVTCNGANYFAAAGTLYPVTSNLGITVTALTPATCGALSVSTIQPLVKVFAKAPDSPTVYLIEDGVRKPVATWDRLIAITGGAAPTILTTHQGGLNDLSVGGPA